MNHQYTEAELNQLHQMLYDILQEIIRVCTENNIQYFIIGGTAIGAYFWQRILPWDDDIDVGMTRENYEKFLKIAPQKLQDNYFLQTIQSDSHVPFWFAKVRKNHTTFVEEQFQTIDMHHGIYVDIFPFDKVSPWKWGEKWQYKLLHFLSNSLTSKEIWQFTHIQKCDINNPLSRGYLACLVILLISKLPKKFILRLINGVQTFFNGTKSVYLKNTITTNEHVLLQDVLQPKPVQLGTMMVNAPADLDAYLHAHYPVLVKDIPQEQRINHKPVSLSFTHGIAKHYDSQ